MAPRCNRYAGTARLAAAGGSASSCKLGSSGGSSGGSISGSSIDTVAAAQMHDSMRHNCSAVAAAASLQGSCCAMLPVLKELCTLHQTYTSHRPAALRVRCATSHDDMWCESQYNHTHVQMPFLLSPAYCVPRITISLCARLVLMLVEEPA